MYFYSVHDLCTDTRGMWETLTSGDEVVITNNGKPSALVIGIPEGAFDEMVQAVRQAKAMIAFNSMRHKAAKGGSMTDEKIEAVIADVRSGADTGELCP